jgi:acetoacetate decarboxylase
VFRLPVIEPLEAVHWRADFTLVPGEIIHDYLAGAP